MLKIQELVDQPVKIWILCLYFMGLNLSNNQIAQELDLNKDDVHTNTIEGVWSLLRFWLRPHRGISQEKLPCYLAFFEFVHNARRRGKALLSSLLSVLVDPSFPY